MLYVDNSAVVKNCKHAFRYIGYNCICMLNLADDFRSEIIISRLFLMHQLSKIQHTDAIIVLYNMADYPIKRHSKDVFRLVCYTPRKTVEKVVSLSFFMVILFANSFLFTVAYIHKLALNPRRTLDSTNTSFLLVEETILQVHTPNFQRSSGK